MQNKSNTLSKDELYAFIGELRHKFGVFNIGTTNEKFVTGNWYFIKDSNNYTVLFGCRELVADSLYTIEHVYTHQLQFFDNYPPKLNTSWIETPEQTSLDVIKEHVFEAVGKIKKCYSIMESCSREIAKANKMIIDKYKFKYRTSVEED